MIGIDIVKVQRFERFLEKHKERALQKYLCAEEIALVKNPQTAAGFFAAKEAVAKALGVGISGEFGFFDIKIKKTDKNAPYFTLSKMVVERYFITKTSLSISHDGGFAIAVAHLEVAKNVENVELFH